MWCWKMADIFIHLIKNTVKTVKVFFDEKGQDIFEIEIFCNINNSVNFFKNILLILNFQTGVNNI